MKTKPVKKLIGMISVPLAPLVHRDWNGNEIRADIATLEAARDGGELTPRNWRASDDDPKHCTGGCFARIFAGAAWADLPSKGLFGCYGPEISYGGMDEYVHAAAAMKAIAKRSEALYAARGGATDAADELGRWFEACGITEVWVAQDAKGSSYSENEWHTLTIGRAVFEVRQMLPETVAMRAELLAKEARDVAEREARETSGVA